MLLTLFDGFSLTLCSGPGAKQDAKTLHHLTPLCVSSRSLALLCRICSWNVPGSLRPLGPCKQGLLFLPITAHLPGHLINSHFAFELPLKVAHSGGSFLTLPPLPLPPGQPVVQCITFQELNIHSTPFFSNGWEALEGVTYVPTEPTVSPASNTVSGRL